MAEICKRCLEMGNKVEPRELKNPLVRNSLSRQDNETYICNLCGMAEALAPRCEVSFSMMRIVLENDSQEAARLPKGTTWGTVYPFPTGVLWPHT